MNDSYVEKLYMGSPITLYVVTLYPTDYPNKVVVRRHVVSKGGNRVVDPEPYLIHDHLPSVRRQLEMTHGLENLGRHPDDDPVIVEVWI